MSFNCCGVHLIFRPTHYDNDWRKSHDGTNPDVKIVHIYSKLSPTQIEQISKTGDIFPMVASGYKNKEEILKVVRSYGNVAHIVATVTDQQIAEYTAFVEAGFIPSKWSLSKTGRKICILTYSPSLCAVPTGGELGQVVEEKAIKPKKATKLPVPKGMIVRKARKNTSKVRRVARTA